MWFYPNALDKHTISTGNKLIYNPDGSASPRVRHESPGPAEEADRLPAPEQVFALRLRLYRPNTTPTSNLDNTRRPPGVVQLKGAGK